jgi:type IV secretory pathway TrbF-like protein
VSQADDDWRHTYKLTSSAHVASQEDEAAQKADYTEKERKRIEAVSWRRFASAGMIANIILAIAVVVLAQKYQHDVVVFRETPHGFSYAGQASEELTPSNFAIASQLGEFVRAYRDVPGDDLQVNRNVERLLIMTADSPPYHALSDMRAHFQQEENNPKVLRKDFTRTVRLNVDALHDPGTNTWRMTWIEDMTKNGNVTTSIHEGALTIAPQPRLPTDQQVASADPAGIVVVQDELH